MFMNDDFYVYTLAYPDGTVFYVGKGSGNRIECHEADARRGVQSLKCDAIRRVWREGHEIVRTKVREHLSGREAGNVERELIAFYSSKDLLNLTSGGEGAIYLKPEEKRRIVVSFSVSGEMLKQLQKRIGQPTLNELQAFARGKAYEAIEAYLAEPCVPEEE